MTLLESLAALVILGTSAVGFLEVFHTTARATRNASDWAQAVAAAESVMERTKIGVADVAAADNGLPPGYASRIETRVWGSGVSEVIVVITSPAGKRLELRRLTREQPGNTPGAVR